MADEAKIGTVRQDVVFKTAAFNCSAIPPKIKSLVHSSLGPASVTALDAPAALWCKSSHFCCNGRRTARNRRSAPHAMACGACRIVIAPSVQMGQALCTRIGGFPLGAVRRHLAQRKIVRDQSARVTHRTARNGISQLKALGQVLRRTQVLSEGCPSTSPTK